MSWLFAPYINDDIPENKAQIFVLYDENSITVFKKKSNFVKFGLRHVFGILPYRNNHLKTKCNF